MQTQPLPKIKIPQTWSSAQALAFIEFLHHIADEIWDSYERPILDLMDRRHTPTCDPTGHAPPKASYKSDDFSEDDLPF